MNRMRKCNDEVYQLAKVQALVKKLKNKRFRPFCLCLPVVMFVTRGSKNLLSDKLHKTACKERYIAGSSTCSTKELSIHLTKILSAVKEGQQKCCETVYSRRGINYMWISKNSKGLLDNLKSRSFSQVSSIKTLDFSTLHTTLPHDKLKTRFDLNLFMTTTENSSIFRLQTKESMLLTSATFLIEKKTQKKFHHISKINLFPLSPIATLTALAVRFSTTNKHCQILT